MPLITYVTSSRPLCSKMLSNVIGITKRRVTMRTTFRLVASLMLTGAAPAHPAKKSVVKIQILAYPDIALSLSTAAKVTRSSATTKTITQLVAHQLHLVDVHVLRVK